MKDYSEDNLIKLALEGHSQAWQEVYRRYYGRVKRVVAWQKWGFRYAEVEEIIQEVFLELVKALPSFRQESSLSTFLTRLAKNKCISVLRRKGAQKRVKEELGYIFDDRKSNDESERQIFVESETGNPEKSILLKEDTAYLIESLEAIHPDCREIIIKRYFEDLSYKEICDELELPLGTVCSRLKRCLKRLREMMDRKIKK